MMPDISGYDLTRILRREPEFAGTPILILTAQSGLEDKLKAFESGADDHLTKPFEGAELLARVGAPCLLRVAEDRHRRAVTGMHNTVLHCRLAEQVDAIVFAPAVTPLRS